MTNWSFSFKVASALVILGLIVVCSCSGEDKVEVKPKEIAQGLIHLFKTTNNDLYKEMFKEIRNDKKINREVYFLRVYAFDTCIMNSNHERKLKDKVRQAFLDEVEESDFYLKDRFKAYDLAINIPHHLGPAWTVARQLMEFCGWPLDALIMGEVGIMFTSDIKMVSKVMESVQIRKSLF